MALYDGFFDAVFNEETMQYDRAYDSGAFVNYFEQTIGSGVCIHGNENSFLVRYQGGEAIVSPGYLFIQGYWLKNDADYPIAVSGAGTHAITAYLNTGLRMIELFAQPKADPEEYPDALVLAYVTIDDAGTVTVEDTRYRTDICGVIDSVGGLSVKVEYAINYIDNEIEGKLEAMEAEINAQSELLDEKILEVTALAEKLTPPPVGTVKFSASQDIEEGWLRCDGSFINEADYPELVAALGKKYPSGDKFSLLSDGEIGRNISNMVMYDGRLWVYSHAEKTLYGVSTEGAETVSIPVTSTYTYFSDFVTPTPDQPIALSIVPHKAGTGAKLFLAQVLQEGYIKHGTTEPTTDFESYFLLFSAEFNGSEDSISLDMPVQSIDSGSSATHSSYTAAWKKDKIPYVISSLIDGVETYMTLINKNYYTNAGNPVLSSYGLPIQWTDESIEAAGLYSSEEPSLPASGIRLFQRYGLSASNNNEIISVLAMTGSSGKYEVRSYPANTYTGTFSASPTTVNERTTILPLAIAGTPAVIYDIQTTGFAVAWLEKTAYDYVTHGLTLPSAARIFYDPGCYLKGKDIYLIFVGTGILFSRELVENDVGYLDTTSVLGTITQYGQLLHSQDENTLFIVGQDSSNKVVVGKMVLNTLFDYANDGAWLPLIASDGIPAYIKAYEPETEGA